MAFRWKNPRNDESAIGDVIGDANVPIIKKRYPRNIQSNRDMRAASRYANVDSRFATVGSTGWVG